MTEPTITSRPYSTAAACEMCCFGRGEHAEFCERWITVDTDMPPSATMQYMIECANIGPSPIRIDALR